MENRPKILLLSLSGIGNYLMHTAVFRSLKAWSSQTEITVWVAPRDTYALAQANPDIDHVIQAPMRRSLLGHLRQVVKLRRLNFTAGLVLYPGQLYKSAAYLWLAGITKRVGHRYPHLGNPDSALWLTKSLPVKANTPDWRQNLDLLSALNIDVPEDIKPYYLSIPAAARARADKSRANIRSKAGEKVMVGMQPGSAPACVWKRWPVDNYGLVGKWLVKKNAHIILFGTSSEIKIIKQLRKMLGRQHCTIVTGKLLTVAAVIEKCHFFLANDSALMHVAAALDVPTLGLFGPTDERRTGPQGKNSLVLRAPGTKPVYDVNNNYDLGAQPHQSMRAIKPEQVFDLVSKGLAAIKE